MASNALKISKNSSRTLAVFVIFGIRDTNPGIFLLKKLIRIIDNVIGCVVSEVSEDKQTKKQEYRQSSYCLKGRIFLQNVLMQSGFL